MQARPARGSALTAAALLAQLGVTDEDARLVLAERPRDDGLVERCRNVLVTGLGEPVAPVTWPARDDFLYVWAFLAALPAVRRYHAARGVPDAVSWTTLPTDSNIVRFGRRFELDDENVDGDDDISCSSSAPMSPAPDELPRRTTLKRAIAAHLRTGRHWHERRGSAIIG
jgi:hypothetical protein